jgi:hypothetical protein
MSISSRTMLRTPDACSWNARIVKVDDESSTRTEGSCPFGKHQPVGDTIELAKALPHVDDRVDAGRADRKEPHVAADHEGPVPVTFRASEHSQGRLTEIDGDDRVPRGRERKRVPSNAATHVEYEAKGRARDDDSRNDISLRRCSNRRVRETWRTNVAYSGSVDCCNCMTQHAIMKILTLRRKMALPPVHFLWSRNPIAYMLGLRAH